MKVPVWAWIAWAILGLALETVAIVTQAAGDTLTETIVRSFPAWLVYTLLLWLSFHFVPRVRKRRTDD